LQNDEVERRVAIVGVIVVVAAALALVIRPPIKEPSFSHELIAMQREVDSFDINFFEGGGRVSLGAVTQALGQQQEDAALVDQKNMDRLGVLLDRYGWPNKKMVGEEAMHAALVVAQRAPDSAFKERVIGLLEATGQNDTPAYARLVDSVAVAKGEPQTYGTAWTCEDGRARPATPIKDPNRALELRAKIGLGPYEKFGFEFCLRQSEGESGPATSLPPVLQPSVQVP
jgi:hypothetical protein